jgi:hypothetical protein
MVSVNPRSVALVGGLALLGGCFAKNDSHKCRDLCGLASTCGLLPSPLGFGTDPASALSNCVSRCELSDEASFTTLDNCFLYAPDASFADLWCGSDDSVCATFSNCISDNNPQADVTGSATAEIQFVAMTSGDAGLPEAPDAAACVQTVDAAVPSPFDQCSGADIEIQSVAVTLGQAQSTRQVTPISCGASGLPALVEANLAPGLLEAAADVRALLPGNTLSVCRQFAGITVILRAGGTDQVMIPLPVSQRAFEMGKECPTVSADPADASGT